MNSFYHTPVLFDSVISGLNIEKGQWIVDCTLGGGGYSSGILSRGGKVVGIDLDVEAINHSRQRLLDEFPGVPEGKEWILVHDNFRHIEPILKGLGIAPRGVIMDLGVSSHQLDTRERGFSYRFPDAEFDMRFDQNNGVPAYYIVNNYPREELYDIITKYGEEERALPIVNALLVARRIKEIRTVGDVLRVIKKSTIGDSERICSRVFQAIRIVVNDELLALKDGLEGVKHMLPSGSRLCVISFHSLEDRIVKQFMKQPDWEMIGDIVRATGEERWRNTRSRSAKLRIAQKK